MARRKKWRLTARDKARLNARRRKAQLRQKHLLLTRRALGEVNRIRKQKGRHRLTKGQFTYLRSRGLPVTIWTKMPSRRKRRRRSRR